MPEFKSLWKDGLAAPPLEVLTGCVLEPNSSPGVPGSPTELGGLDAAALKAVGLGLGGDQGMHQGGWMGEEGGTSWVEPLVRRCLYCLHQPSVIRTL